MFYSSFNIPCGAVDHEHGEGSRGKEERGKRREIRTEENLVQETQMGIYFGGNSNLVSLTENNVQTNEFLGKKLEFVVKTKQNSSSFQNLRYREVLVRTSSGGFEPILFVNTISNLNLFWLDF